MIGAIGLAISSRLVDFKELGVAALWSSGSGAVFDVCAALSVAGGLRTLKQLAEADKLKKDLIQLEGLDEDIRQAYADLLRLELQKLARSLSFGVDERISVYKHHGRAFIMLGRWAGDTLFEQPGRALYPADQGCIGEAWRKGEAVEAELPDPSQESSQYRDALRSRWRIPKGEVDGLRMKPRSLAACRLDHSEGRRGSAVIVFESTNPRICADILKSFGNSERQNIIEWLQTMERFEPRPSYARERGY